VIHKHAPIPRPLALPLEPLYAWAVARRNKRFDKGKGLSRAPVPVISVGNISVGGVGKSPHCQLIARLCKKLGKNPAIVLRGYGPKDDGVSDELAEHRQRSPDIPAAADPDRLAAIAHLITGQVPGAGARRPDVVILDDGFQHRRLKRDLDLVLIDSTRSPFADRLLPAGWLREPVSALARASAVILTRADLPPSRELQTLRDDVARVTGAPPLAETAHAWEPEIPALVSGRETTKPKEWLKGRRVVAACAIGNPSAFESQLAAAGARIAETVAFRDHARLGKPEADRIAAAARAASADAVVCTGKDWTKLAHVAPDAWPCPVLRPAVAVEILKGRDELDDLVARALKITRTPGAEPDAETDPGETADDAA